MIKEKIEISDKDIIELLEQGDEKAKDLIYEKYGYIIDVMLKKYYKGISIFLIDKEELRCEALVGFSNGINHYLENKEASLATFLSICTARKIIQYFEKNNSSKYRFMKDTLSIEYEPQSGKSIYDLYAASNATEPLNTLTSEENVKDIINLSKETLSPFEYRVFKYMVSGLNYNAIAKKLDKTPKQIDNTMYRIKSKLKNVLNTK